MSGSKGLVKTRVRRERERVSALFVRSERYFGFFLLKVFYVLIYGMGKLGITAFYRFFSAPNERFKNRLQRERVSALFVKRYFGFFNLKYFIF